MNNFKLLLITVLSAVSFSAFAQDPNDTDKEDRKPTKRVVGRNVISQKDSNGKDIYIPYTLGSLNKVEVDKGVTITIYVPPTLKADQKYPAIILVDPLKGSNGHLDKFTKAADLNEMIVISMNPIKGVNLTKKERTALNNLYKQNNSSISPINILLNVSNLQGYMSAISRKLHNDFPINSKRLYVAGFGERCYTAFIAKDAIRAEGIIAVNGGGRAELTASNSDSYIAICNPESPTRWDVATTFNGAKSSNKSYLIFDSNNLVSSINTAMLKINAMYMLKQQKGSDKELALRFEDLLLSEVEKHVDDTSRMYAWIEFIQRYGLEKKDNIEKLEKWEEKALSSELSTEIKRGYSDAVRSLVRYYGKGRQSYNLDNGKASIQNSIKKLAEEYKGTHWSDIYTVLAQKTAKAK